MKKYYLSDEEEKRRTILILDKDDIEEKIDLSGLVFTTDLSEIEEYDIEGMDCDRSMSLEESKSFMFMNSEELSWNEKEYLFEKDIYGDLEQSMTEEYGNITEEKMIEILEKNIFEKMKNKQIEPETFSAYYYWDGNNHKEIYLEGFYDSYYIDYTDKLEGMEEIDMKKGNTSIDRLYELKNGEKVIVTTSFFQGALPWVEFIDEKYESLDEYVKQKYTTI